MLSRDELQRTVRKLRMQGLTYKEITSAIGVEIPKSTLSYICKDIMLSNEQRERILLLSQIRLEKLRKKALLANRKVFDNKIELYRTRNQDIVPLMSDNRAKLITLAMLYLGEGAKWKSRRGPLLGSADPNIIRMYIQLLHDCYGVDSSAMHARVQHRADQNSLELMGYWSGVTGIEQSNFYPCYIDKRTIGKPTRKQGYHGVCAVSCAGTYIQLELEQIAGIIKEALIT